MKRIVVVSDIQAPLHDVKAVAAVTQFIRDFQPDMIATVGDEADCTSISRHVRGRDKEYSDNLQAGLDSAHAVMRGFREAAPRAEMIVQRSNHTTTRLENYVGLHAPGIASLRGLTWPALMRYDEIDVKLSLSPTSIAPGWHMLHGDEGRSATYAGGTALKLANQLGTSVLCGHTHKQGLIHDHDAHSGKVTKHRFGFEVGHLMDMRKADSVNGGYLKFGGSNWQAGFGLLYVTGKVTLPVPIPIVNGKFVVEGKEYTCR